MVIFLTSSNSNSQPSPIEKLSSFVTYDITLSLFSYKAQCLLLGLICQLITLGFPLNPGMSHTKPKDFFLSSLTPLGFHPVSWLQITIHVLLILKEDLQYKRIP